VKYFQILVLPAGSGVGAKGKYEVNFFNNTDIAFVPASGLFDFVHYFNDFAPKVMKQVS
jgi:hypothetical protein